MYRREVSRLLMVGEAFLRAGRHTEARQIARRLARAVDYARQARHGGVREADLYAYEWAASVIGGVELAINEDLVGMVSAEPSPQKIAPSEKASRIGRDYPARRKLFGAFPTLAGRPAWGSMQTSLSLAGGSVR